MTGIQTTSNRKRKRTSKPFNFGFFIDCVRNISYSSGPYRFLISGRAPQKIEGKPSEFRTGDTVLGNEFLSGTYSFLGYELNVGTKERKTGAPWNHCGFGKDWQTILHGFSWLRDLRSIANDSARQKMRQLILEWISLHTSIDSFAWRSDILGERLYSWLLSAEFMLSGCDHKFREKFFGNIALQSRHLCRTVRQGPAGAPRFTAIKGLYAAGICIPNGDKILEIAAKNLLLEIDRQILPDGSHIERSPSAHIRVLSSLFDIRESLEKANFPIPENIHFAIDRMASMMRFYRHGDGAVSLFNDSLEETAWLVDLVLAKANVNRSINPNTLHSGFQRHQAGRTLAIVDCGAPPNIGGKTHAGTLSFELSIGKERLIVNCGTWRGGDERWRAALRATAAHSTLTVDDTNSSELLPCGGIGIGPENVFFNREEEEGATWLEMQHDGFEEPFNLVHKRQLYLSSDGSNLRGTDILTQQNNGIPKGRSFAIRFHLHPDVQTSLVHDGKTVLLRLQSGSGWQMQTKGANLDLAESIYCGQPGQRRRSNQIVMTGPIDPEETSVSWVLTRIPKN